MMIDSILATKNDTLPAVWPLYWHSTTARNVMHASTIAIRYWCQHRQPVSRAAAATSAATAYGLVAVAAELMTANPRVLPTMVPTTRSTTLETVDSTCGRSRE